MPKPYGAVAQVVIVGELHGQVTNNVLHFGGNGLEFNLNQLITDVIDCINTTLKQAVSEDVAFKKVTARLLYPVLGDPVEAEFAPGTLGTGLPAQASFVAMLIRLNTGLGGKTKRGRMFIPGAIENSVNASRLSDSALLLLAAFCACMIGKFLHTVESPKAWELAVYSRKLGTALGATPEVGTFPVKTMTPIREVASMRSRRIGHGN
jgi:hypothetical protein